LTFGECEVISFRIPAFFDLHLDWAIMQVDIENVFNNVLQTAIFKELCYVGEPLANIVIFIRLFYDVHFSLYY
jgi:hypothetical protein